MPTLSQYIRNKHDAEKRRLGYIEYASLEVHHFHKSCNCKGLNQDCRFVTKREWRKPDAYTK